MDFKKIIMKTKRNMVKVFGLLALVYFLYSNPVIAQDEKKV